VGRSRLSTIIMVGILLVIVVVMATSFVWNVYRLQERSQLELREKARLITSQFLAIRTFMAESQDEPSLSNEYEHLDPVAAEAGLNQILEGSPWRIKEVWLEGSSDIHQPDPSEGEILAALRSNPDLKEHWSLESGEDQQFFYYMIPIRMEENCLTCHGIGSQDGVEKDLVLPKEFTLGELAGAISLRVPMDTYKDMLRADTLSQLIFTLTLVVLTLVATSALMGHFVTRPLSRLTDMATELGTGNHDAAQREIRAYGEIGVLVSEFKDMAARLRDLYRSLEDKVQQRTEELLEQREELRRINRELDKSNRMKSTFLASMSHELRTPLTAIIAFAELLLERIGGVLTQRQEEYVGGVRDNSRQLLSIINDILDLAKIEAGRMELRVSRFHVGTLLEEAVENIKPLAVRKGVTLRIAGDTLCKRLPEIEGDRQKIQQVLTNLLGNAIKFTPEDGLVLLDASLDDDRGEVLVLVSDTGIGIPPEKQEDIFDAFRQVDGSTTREYRGTGLGLSLAKHLVAMHGGRIWLESKEGRGSAFYFTLPIELREAESEEDWSFHQ